MSSSTSTANNGSNKNSMSTKLQVMSLQSPLSIFIKSIAIPAVLLFFLFYIITLLNHPNNQFCDPFAPFQLFKKPTPSFNNITTKNDTTSTNISHIGFTVIGSLASWKQRQQYTQSWWRPNVTRGYVFLDNQPSQEFLPWPSISPPFQINDDITKLKVYPKLVNPGQIRLFRSVLDMYRVGDKGLRWVIICDDDTLIFVDNLAEVLRKYDHTKFVYIGTNSEFIKANADLSFDMGYGGAGYALSYPLVEAYVKMIDACLERYPYIGLSDQLAHVCLADIGVSLTIEKGMHQVDLRGDISGFLSYHPQSPLITLHHLDIIDPIFPSMDRYEAVRHLMKPAKVDQSRLLQQTICYNRHTNWSFSVSWGYSAHIYENIIPRSTLRRPLETFHPFSGSAPPLYMFNTRPVNDNPCEAPHVFFFKSIKLIDSGKQVITTYVRPSPRNLPPCLVSGNRSADHVSEITVVSPATTRKTAGVIECCDVGYKDEVNVSDIRIRSCSKGEVFA